MLLLFHLILKKWLFLPDSVFFAWSLSPDMMFCIVTVSWMACRVQGVSQEAPGCGSEGSEVHAWCWGVLDRFLSSLTESAGSSRRQPRSHDLLLLNPLESSLTLATSFYATENILCLLTLLSHRRKLIPEHALRDRMVVSQVLLSFCDPCVERECVS